MNLPALKKIAVASATEPAVLARQLMQMIQNLVESVTPLINSPRAFSVVQDVELTAATAKIVSHKLPLKTGQRPSGWLITDIDTNTTVKRTAWDDRTITIEAAANCTAKIEVW